MSKKLIAVFSALAIAFAMSGCGSNDIKSADSVDTATDTNVSDNAQTPSKEAAPDAQKSESVEKVTPTFMYFTSASDEDHAGTMNMIEELKSEYGDKVNFNLIDIDTDKEAAANFPVEGQTPALIMLNTTNDISAMEFVCSDKETLKKDIEAALK